MKKDPQLRVSNLALGWAAIRQSLAISEPSAGSAGSLSGAYDATSIRCDTLNCKPFLDRLESASGAGTPAPTAFPLGEKQ